MSTPSTAAGLTQAAIDLAEWVCDNPSKVLTLAGTRELYARTMRVQAEAAEQALADAVERVALIRHGERHPFSSFVTCDQCQAETRQDFGLAAAPASPEVEG